VEAQFDQNSLILVSVDDHVIEPPGMFEGRLPARFEDRAPRVVHLDDGTDAWSFEGQMLSNVGLNAVAGRPPEDFNADPLAFDEMRSGCWNVHDRVRDMDADGLLGTLCFPSFPQFCGQLFARTADKDLALAVVRAYNDWHIEEWAGSYPGRFIPLGVVPIWDPELMAAEVHRLARMGCHAVSFSENPYLIGLPSFHEPAWEPFWAACVEEGTVVCIHIGSSSTLPNPHPNCPIPLTFSITPVNLLQAAVDLLWSPVFPKFPTLKIALSEGGIGWIPYMLERVDYCYHRQGKWSGFDFGELLPSDIFRRHFITCFITDDVGLRLRDTIGLERICWESDYPHSDSTWPGSPESVARWAANVPRAEVDMITHLNAMREFQFDPWSVLAKEETTVGYLRSRAADVPLTFEPPRRRDRSRKDSGEGYSIIMSR
jgi:predicted TIM-barrel fold metal-dependent hydrolase